MELIVDRFEENFAVCEDENLNMINIDKAFLPHDVIEGDVLIKNDDNIIIDKELTKQRRLKALEMLKNL